MSAVTLILAGGGTGGHVYPLIAVAEAIGRLAPDARLVFVGTERGMETRVVPERGYELELLRVRPIRGGGLGGALQGIARAAASVPEARALLRRLAPAAVLSIGGYAAGPVSLAARTLGVPLALMEPNGVMGLANRLIAPFVQRAYVAFDEVMGHFPKERVRRTGVPLREGFVPRAYRRKDRYLRVLVLGGSQGAKALNEAVPEALSLAKTPVRVVHQCGRAHETEVRERYARLGAAGRVTVVPFIEDMPAALAACELVIGRSGASAVSEMCAVGRPSLLIPYPYAAGDHQRLNAEALERAGAAVCLLNVQASADRIASELDRLASEPGRLEQMAEQARRQGRPDAARDIASDLLALAGQRKGAEAEPRVADDEDSDHQGRVHAAATPLLAGASGEVS
jgi:UDP-N-acetylglucosamine--N-acetylmuramyl-(pentapeptide) pyrophosphoryl-undecaprenol N-acetylglucosamine transferase